MATLGGYLNSKTPLPSSTDLISLLTSLPEKVLIVTADSRILVGTLSACDQSTNLVGFPDPREEAKAHSTCLGLEHRRGTNHPNARRR